MALTYSPQSGATILSSGTWIATKDTDGKTYYQSATGTDVSARPISGATKYTGPVIISGGILTVASGATASGAYVSGGWPTIYVESGGTLESSVNVNGWTYVRSGGVSYDNTLVSDAGGVAAGGSSVSDTFLYGSSGDGGGDTFTVSRGGYIGGNTVVGSGNTLIVNSGATAEPITVQNGGSLQILSPAANVGSNSANITTYSPPSGATVLSSGTWIATKDTDGKTYYQSATGNDASARPIASATKYTGPVIISGGILTVASGATASGAYVSGGWPTIYVETGGTLESSVNVNGWTYVRSGGVSHDNTLVSDAGGVAAGGSSVSDTFLYGLSGNGGGDTFTVSSGGYIASSYVGSGTTLRVSSGGSSDSPTIAAGGNYYVTQGSSLVCFLAGSMIRTPNGDVAVEDIKIGDQVVTFDWRNNQDVIRPVVWAGKACATVRFDVPNDEAGWPVRILKNAIADNVPYKDMLITSEHCLFFKNKFVPVRMLINGISIFYDKSIRSYNYYHIETEPHSVITADGMLTESYLDTGNGPSFWRKNKITSFRGGSRNWDDDASAPLCVERVFVETLFRSLEWRKNRVSGCYSPLKDVVTIDDPNLHLITEAGSTIRPMRRTGSQYSFMLPPGTKSVRIVSRASRPSDVIGPFVNDRRYLGVAVGEVRLFYANRSYNIAAHLQNEELEGWYEREGDDSVWTNGNAFLPLDKYITDGNVGILSMIIRAAGPYLISQQETQPVKSYSM